MTTSRKVLLLVSIMAGAANACGDNRNSEVFAETWNNFPVGWHAMDGNPITVAEEVGCPAFQHETITFSGGRVVSDASTAVEAGQPYCLTAWIRGTAGSVPFLGLQLADNDGHPTGGEQWPIGLRGYTSGFPETTAAGVTTDGSWGWYAAPFEMEEGATFVIMKDENFGSGAADFASIQLFAGSCPLPPTAICAAAE